LSCESVSDGTPAREIPWPAGENADLRDDVGEEVEFETAQVPDQLVTYVIWGRFATHRKY